MKKEIIVRLKLLAILMISLTFYQLDLQGQNQAETERTIYLMRAKQFYGSGAKMDLMINGELFHKLKSGNRLIIKANLNDTLNLQIIYPMIKSHKSRIFKITPDENNTELYIDLFYWGEGYNPLKHVGTLNPAGGMPDFNIEIVEMSLNEGKTKFNNSEIFKDNKKIMEKRFPK
jgi:hypothetical protein